MPHRRFPLPEKVGVLFDLDLSFEPQIKQVALSCFLQKNHLQNEISALTLKLTWKM